MRYDHRVPTSCQPQYHFLPFDLTKTYVTRRSSRTSASCVTRARGPRGPKRCWRARPAHHRRHRARQRGEISSAPGLRITYLPQEAKFTSDNTLREEARLAFASVLMARMREIEQQMAMLMSTSRRSWKNMIGSCTSNLAVVGIEHRVDEVPQGLPAGNGMIGRTPQRWPENPRGAGKAPLQIPTCCCWMSRRTTRS